MEECLRGNEEAWSAVVDKYKNLVYSAPFVAPLSYVGVGLLLLLDVHLAELVFEMVFEEQVIDFSFLAHRIEIFEILSRVFP